MKKKLISLVSVLAMVIVLAVPNLKAVAATSYSIALGDASDYQYEGATYYLDELTIVGTAALTTSVNIPDDCDEMKLYGTVNDFGRGGTYPSINYWVSVDCYRYNTTDPSLTGVTEQTVGTATVTVPALFGNKFPTNISDTWNVISIVAVSPDSITVETPLIYGEYNYYENDWSCQYYASFTIVYGETSETVSENTTSTETASSQTTPQTSSEPSINNNVNAALQAAGAKARAEQNTPYRYVYNSQGIMLTSTGGYLPAGGSVTYIKPTNSEYEAADIVILPIAGDHQKVLMDLNLTNSGGEEVHELGGYVQVAVPLPFTPAAGKTIAVYRIEGNTAIPLASYITDDALVFTTNHFSTFAFVEADSSATTAPNATSAVTSPATADISVMTILIVFAAAVCGIVIVRARRS